MRGWRWAVAATWLALVGVPLALPLIGLAGQRDAWHAWGDWQRLGELASNTLLLAGATLLLTVPAGVLGAVLLYRSDLPGRRFLRSVTILSLFIPLPLFASAWQAALGSGGWLPLALWSTPPPGDPDLSPTGMLYKPWAQGWAAAAWVQAMAGLPWVVWVVGQGLTWVERELEEEALLAAGPWSVFWTVTLPRCRASVLAAALLVALQAANEITVTDTMQVRTFAEEVYTQMVAGSSAALARAVAAAVPVVLLTAALVLLAARRWQWNLPPLGELGPPLCLVRLGRWRWPALGLLIALVGVLVGVPLASLVWKAGLAGSPEVWSLITAWHHVRRVADVHGGLVLRSLLLAAVAGGLTASLALVSCWLAAESRWLRVGLLGLLAAAWALPGPLVGLGLKESIEVVMVIEDHTLGPLGASSRPLQLWLYRGPSLLPVLWVDLIRLFPYAVALLWPVVRLLPPQLREAARSDGAGAFHEMRWLIWPLTRTAWVRAALAVGVLALGELSAGKLVATPGSMTFAQELFMQLHYGVTNNQAALCLVMLALVGGGGLLALLPARQMHN